jgi:Hint domain
VLTTAQKYSPLNLRENKGTILTADLEDSGQTSRRTRRNIVRMGVIFSSVVLAKTAATACPPKLNLCPTPACFLKGTKIETADGERKIEDLKVGDLLPTKFGGLRPVQWIGRYPFKKSDPSKPWIKEALPVRIARSALAPDVPHSDLYVTWGHSLLIDGVLVPAEVLINGTTITRYEAREFDELEFFHIKLEAHDVIYAEGAPAETLLNVQESAVNFAEYFRRYGTVPTDENRCAPHVHIWGGRVELKSRLRSALSPWIDLRNRAEVVRDRLEGTRVRLLVYGR